MFFIKNVIYLCEKLKISQNQLGKKTNIPISTIKNLFQDKIKNPTLENAYIISKVLNADLLEMIEVDMRQKEMETNKL